MMDEEIRQAVSEVREMKQMCGNINMKLTNIVTQRGQDWKKKLEAEYQRGFEDGKKEAESSEAIEQAKANAFNKGMLFKEEKIHDAYKRGFEDGVTKRTDGDACAGCEYKGKTGEHLPCHYCKNAYTNQWRAKKEEIGVGDVVETKSGTIFVVTKITSDGFAVGFTGDGNTGCFDITKLTKTGGHYNINEILGGLCDD